MDFIATYWYAWLLVWLACSIYAIMNQQARAERVWREFTSDSFFDFGSSLNSLNDGVTGILIASLFGWLAGALLLLAGVIHLIRYIPTII